MNAVAMPRSDPSPPEILAPIGGPDVLEAAIRGGADGVYFGLEGFNARARATNFTRADLDGLMQKLRDHGIHGYAALNTLVFDPEFETVEQHVRACASAGVDAVIVQDLGIARLVREVAPDLPIHASTQMTCTDADAISLARDLGVRRVILPRELSLAEIESLAADSPVDLEVFVHGALCISYSGQCLTSQAIGGRSANRGACAQACRLPYELVVDGGRHDAGERAFLLSPQDLDALALVPELVRLGVRALKIEGRLKGPEYVYRAARLYKKAVEAAVGLGPAPNRSEHQDLLQVFSRGSGPGFLLGVDHSRLVEGRTSDHRGVLVGSCYGQRRHNGRPCLAVRLEASVGRGDGILVEGGYAGAGEVGGRIWNVYARGRDVENAEAGSDVLLWLGPETVVETPHGALPLSVQRRVFRTNARKPLAAQDAYRDSSCDHGGNPVDMRLTGRLGQHPRLVARVDGLGECAVELDAPLEQARSVPISREVIREKLGRLGGTPFTLRELEVDLPDGAMLAISSLNRARRFAVQELLRLEAARPTTIPTTSVSAGGLLGVAAFPTADRSAPPAVFVLCRNCEQAEAALEAGADGVYLDFLALEGTKAALDALRAQYQRPVGIALPRVTKPGDDRIDRYVHTLEPDALLIRALGSLARLQRLSRLNDLPGADGQQRHVPVRVGDFSLNVTNRLSASEMLQHGLSAFTPSYDLDSTQLLALLDGNCAQWAEVVLHHPMPLFHMEHCVFAALLSDGRDHTTCGRPCERHQVEMRDRTGRAHPVVADVGCRNTIFHASAQSGLDILPALLRCGVRRFRIEVLRESATVTERLVAGYAASLRNGGARQPALDALESIRGYEVVRGSFHLAGRRMIS